MNLLSKEKINISMYVPMIGVVSFFSIILLVGYFLILPFYEDLNEQNQTIQEKKESIEEREQNLEKIAQLKRDFPGFPEKVEFLEEIKLAQSEVEQIMSQLDKIAQESDIELNSFRPNEGQVATASTGVSVDIKGTYKNFRKFLSGVENNQLILNVKSVNVNGNDGKNLTMSLAINAGL